MCACACVCIAATAKDSVFHNGGTLKDGEALEGKELNLCIYFFLFIFILIMSILHAWSYGGLVEREKKAEFGRESCMENVSGLVFSFKEAECLQNQIYEQMSKLLV